MIDFVVCCVGLIGFFLQVMLSFRSGSESENFTRAWWTDHGILVCLPLKVCLVVVILKPKAEMSLRIKGPARVAKLLAETASEEILAGRRKRAHTQSTLLGEIFTDVELPDDVWRGVRWDERVCENICSKYMETLEALTNDVAALNNWAIALKTLAVIKAKKLLQLLRKRQITPAQVPNLTWLFKPSYDKYCGIPYYLIRH